MGFGARMGRPALALAAATLIAACGGSSSETPWPTQPDFAPLGPAGEQGPTGEMDPEPDAGAARPERAPPPER